MFNIDKFKVIPESDLDEVEFDYFPVWSEHYDWEEIEEIVSWGLDKNEILKLFEKNQQENQHCLYTTLKSNPFPERMRIFIRANLITQNGIELKGYIMNENAFCLGVFFRGEKYYFSSHPMLGDLFNHSAQSLCLALGIKIDKIFPISYETDFFNKTGVRILGKFWIPQSKTFEPVKKDS